MAKGQAIQQRFEPVEKTEIIDQTTYTVQSAYVGGISLEALMQETFKQYIEEIG